MNVQELRIGNWIYAAYSLRPVQVTGIHKEEHDSGQMNYHILYEEDSRYWETIRPIKLTPEILEKAGFEKEGSHYSIDNIENDGLGTLCISFYVPDGVIDQFQICQYVEGIAINRIQYVHQLQNVYYFMTGEELKLDLYELY